MPAPLKILIAPLDWGLGHTTRCIPVIRYLQQLGHQVIAAAEGASARLLSDNFPGLLILPLRGYRIQYSKNKKTFTSKIVSQVPHILKVIREEHQWLKTQQRLHSFDLIISDNRYGLYHQEVHNVILTHQLQIKSGKGSFADGVLRCLHYRMLQRFTECWVVDEFGEPNLSGDLAHPRVLPANAQYIGILSQFTPEKERTNISAQPDRILILLSGPEPMRSQLEQALLQQVENLGHYQFTMVAGNPLGEKVPVPANVQYHTHLNAVDLQAALAKSSLVICRSGYSTVMDLAVMGKKALLIPTPGQTEQEYLAQYLKDKNYFYYCPQHKLRLVSDIPAALATRSLSFPVADQKMQKAVDRFLEKADQKNKDVVGIEPLG